MLNTNTKFSIKHGDRIAQLVISELALLPLKETEELDFSKRGNRGHGSTGR
jgi:dUTPase